MSALRPPVRGKGKPHGPPESPWVIFSITLPLDLRDLIRAECQPGETMTATVRQLLREAIAHRGVPAKLPPATSRTGRSGKGP